MTQLVRLARKHSSAIAVVATDSMLVAEIALPQSHRVPMLPG
jgi:hypothetical protein